MKFKPDQKTIVRSYSEAVSLGKTLNVWNEHYGTLEKMILGLSNCAMLGATDVFNIVIDNVINIQAGLKQKDQEDGQDKRNADATDELTGRLVSFFESMPRACELRVSLPHFPNWGFSSFGLAPGIRIEPGVQKDMFPANKLNRLANLLTIPASTQGASLVFEVRGYAGASSDSAGVSTGFALAKLCTFLFAQLGVMTSNLEKILAGATAIDLASGDKSKVSFPEKLALHIGSLKPNESKFSVLDISRGMSLLGSFRLPETDAERIEAFKTVFQPMSKVLARRNDAEFKPLAAAIEWHQDSTFSEDQTIAYLAACIGLESIFGETDMGEMSKRLQDRYAFLLGTDREDRQKLAEEYAGVLRIRGQLVHARVKKLGQRDYEALGTAREMLRKSILHELRPFLR